MTIFITADHNFSWRCSELPSVLQQNCSQLLLFLLKAADLSQNPLENHSALQLTLLLPSSILLPFSREENKSFAVWGQLNRIMQLKVAFFPLTSHSAIHCHQ